MKTNKILAVPLILVMMFSAAGLVYSNVIARPMGDATAPGLGQAGAYSVIGKAGVTNSGTSILSGLVGADSSIDGGITSAGEILADAVNQAEADATAADIFLRGQAGSATSAGPDLSGVTLGPGVYTVGSTLLPGVLTLNGPGIYIFLSSSDLTSSGSVSLINGATACNVYWDVVSSASITGGSFVGTIIAGQNISLGTGVTLDGRALALVGQVTLLGNTISGPNCSGGDTTVATSDSPRSGLPDNPQPESGSTEAFIGTATAIALANSARVGVPSTGGTPLQSDGSTLLLVGIIGLSVLALFFAIRKIRQIFGSK